MDKPAAPGCSSFVSPYSSRVFSPAVQQTGAVRAADQFVPGATVTATQGDKKVVAYTDESGRYKLDLTPGVWQIQIEMFEFTPVRGEITVGSEPAFKDWAIEIPRIGQAVPVPVAPVEKVRRASHGVRGSGSQAAHAPARACCATGPERNKRSARVRDSRARK